MSSFVTHLTTTGVSSSFSQFECQSRFKGYTIAFKMTGTSLFYHVRSQTSKHMVQLFKYNSLKMQLNEILYNFEMQNIVAIMNLIE